MKDRTSGIIKRSVAVVAFLAAWLICSRLLAMWMSNHHVNPVKWPVKAIINGACWDTTYEQKMQDPSLCAPTGYKLGYGNPEQGMPTSSFFGKIYTDEFGFFISYFMGALVLIVVALIVAMTYGYIKGDELSNSDPCHTGQCGCDCECCKRRLQIEVNRTASRRSAQSLGIMSAATAIGLAIVILAYN